MEQLLLILFLLFSVISALLERRKRRRQMEEAQRRQQQTEDGAPVPQAEQEKEEEEEWGGWPFPGGDPFEPRPTPPPTARAEPDEGEVVVLESAAPADGQSLLEQLERQAQEAEQRARDEEERARERAQEIQQSRQRMAARMRQLGSAGAPGEARPRGRSPWRLTPDRARQAVVYAEILGPCKADRDEEWRW